MGEEHAKTGNMMSFVVKKTITGQTEFQDFLNSNGEEEIGGVWSEFLNFSLPDLKTLI